MQFRSKKKKIRAINHAVAKKERNEQALRFEIAIYFELIIAWILFALFFSDEVIKFPEWKKKRVSAAVSAEQTSHLSFRLWSSEWK